MSQHQLIDITRIRTDGGTQSRAALDHAAIGDYAELIKEGGEMPAVVVFYDGTDIWLASGFHRLHAHREAGKTQILADVRVGTQAEAMWFSCGSNSAHGIRPTNADKRHAVTMALAAPEAAGMSHREIARHCGVTHTFVNMVANPKPPTPKPPTTGGPSAPSGRPSTGAPAEPPKVETVSSPDGVETVSTPEGKAEAEQIAEDAHGDTNATELLVEMQDELAKAQALLKVAEADDLKAEAVKHARMAEVARARQNELMVRVNEREAELTKLTNTLRRIGRAVGEDDPTKIAAVVEALARKAKSAA